VIVVRLLSLKLQPTFVLVDTDTHNTEPAPPVQPIELTAAAVGNLPLMLTQAHQQMEQHLIELGVPVDPMIPAES
jgi:hypothetical protein